MTKKKKRNKYNIFYDYVTDLGIENSTAGDETYNNNIQSCNNKSTNNNESLAETKRPTLRVYLMWADQHNFRGKREVCRLRRVQTTRIMFTPVHV